MEYFSNFIWEKGNEAYMRVSLVLQHALVRKKSVLLACVCESGNEGETGVTESGYFTEGLVEWFHRSFLRQCEGKISDGEVEKLLLQEVSKLQGEIRRFVEKKGERELLHYWGILLWDNRFWIFSKGDCEGYLVNKRFQRRHMRRLGICGYAEQYEQCKQMEQEVAARFGQVKHLVVPTEAGMQVQPGHREQSLSKQTSWFSGRLQHNLGILLCTPGFMSEMELDEVAEILDLSGETSDARIEKRLQELWKENERRGEVRSVGAVYLHT